MLDLLQHYVKIALRNLRKYPAFSLINLGGLALGLACTLLCLLFVRSELSYDRFHENADRIVRLTVDANLPGQIARPFAITAPPMGPGLKLEFPEIMEQVRFRPYFEGGLAGPVTVEVPGGERYFEDFFWTDEGVFRLFSWGLQQGNPDTALRDPYSVVLTESMARKYFGDQEAMGQVLTINSGFSENDYRVTGIVNDVPANSHLDFDILVSFSTLDKEGDVRNDLESWFTFDMYTYFLLPEGYDPADLEAKFPAFLERILGENSRYLRMELQNLPDIHLTSQMISEFKPNGDMMYIWIFLAIALVALIIAAINFMNLSTARSANRAKEVGVRKVVGAERDQLVRQFLGESLVFAFLSLIIAIGLVNLFLPVFNSLTSRELEFNLFSDPSVLFGSLGVTVLLGLFAGSYPALFLSSFRPVEVLKGRLRSGFKSGTFRRVLVVLQFAVSIILLIATGVVSQQLNYMQDQDLGVDISNTVVLPVRDMQLRDNYEAVRDRLERVPGVEEVSLSAIVFGVQPPAIAARPFGSTDWTTIDTIVVDQNFMDQLDLDLMAGRAFLQGSEADVTGAFVINEAAVRLFDWGTPEEALGEELQWIAKRGPVIGVVKDFHYRSLRYDIQPLVMHVRPLVFHYFYARLTPGDPGPTLNSLDSTWSELFPGLTFEYFFLDDHFEELYRPERNLGRAFGYFAAVAILVGCLGLFGLASFMAEQRTKELGIRKVLGASVPSLVGLLSKEFLILVAVANLIAWPVAWIIMGRWLEDFAYRIELGIGVFVLSAVGALLIAQLTVTWQALRAATTRPVRSLRYE
ncbi:MAG: ABC transporter permease [Acidobacteriota bacterium]